VAATDSAGPTNNFGLDEPVDEDEEGEPRNSYKDARLRNVRENEAFLEALDQELNASSTSSTSSTGVPAAKSAKATCHPQPVRCDRITTFAQLPSGSSSSTGSPR
jgi:hypothetical protein